MKNAIYISWLLFFASSCQGQVINQLLPSEFKAQIENETDSYQIVDLRTDEEVAQGRVPGAEQMDYYDDSFNEKLNALNKETTYYIYCAAGGRSGKVLAKMSELDFKKVYEMKGGMNAWKAAGLETE